MEGVGVGGTLPERTFRVGTQVRMTCITKAEGAETHTHCWMLCVYEHI